MTDAQIADLKADFLEWSGGFPPESKDQIVVYCDYAIDVDYCEADANRVLTDWMNSDVNW